MITIVHLWALCSFVGSLVLGLVAHVGSRNAPWSKLNTDGRVIVVGGFICLFSGFAALTVSVLEYYHIIDKVAF